MLTPDQKYHKATKRMSKMSWTVQQLEFIFTDWADMDIHLSWLLTASREEIESWGIAGEWGQGQFNENQA